MVGNHVSHRTAVCGTDLGLMRTKAEPEGDGYRLTGTKDLDYFWGARSDGKYRSPRVGTLTGCAPGH